jgi:glycosyltransferase involved in cell wall biosynthesis
VTLLKPGDRNILAAAVVDSLVIASDPDARRSGLGFLHFSRPWINAVVSAVREIPDASIRSLAQRLLDTPQDPVLYFDLRSQLAKRGEAEPSVAALFDLAWEAECNSRMGYHLGPLHDNGMAAVSVEELRALPTGTPLSDDANPEVLVVVPFRDRGTGERLRNLLACLLALRDQSFPRERYRVTVVESDDVPRWRGAISPRADHYLFAAKPGAFNKSWAVNAGVVNSPGGAEAICILDADVLVDREFIARNVARFFRPGTGGHLTYRNMFCLTAAASSSAIRERIFQRAADTNVDRLRGFLLRRPPGCCLWVRSSAFYRIYGMDERYEGWGGEDNDFAYRLDFGAPFDHYDDWLFHMDHPPSSVLQENGDLINAHIPAMSWRPEDPIGRLDRFVDPIERRTRG